MNPVLFFSITVSLSIIIGIIRRKIKPEIKKRERLFSTIIGTFGWILFIVWVPLFLSSLSNQTEKTSHRIEQLVK